MKDLNEELWKLGVPAKTQHNEVAPAQHELAPIYEEANLATDHNQLIMETMKRLAVYHNMRCLLHEKPFAGVNGSGKHNNWSLSTDNGVNLLEPGASPERNIQFLLILSCILKAIDTHAELLRQSASDVGNDLRLGADEAPPAIVSIFLGEQLEDVVRQLVETGSADSHIEGGILRTGVSTLPDINKDATDRNRTSPFAFTGNKFEFRMVGSADSCASPITIINAIVAEAFCEAADLLEHADNFNKAVHDLIKDNMTKHQRIIFSGNGYSEEWVREAERRGLPNIRSTIEAASALTSEKSIRLFEKFGIFTESELRSREEIIYETYAKTQNIEVLTMIDMARKQILPACMQYARNLAETVVIMRKAGVEPMAEAEKLAIVNTQINDAQESLKMLIDAEDRAGRIRGMRDQAFFYKDIVRPLMDNLRAPCDNLEKLVDKKMWPFPTYEDLMFEV
jgi:glutamine synthetase